MNLLVIDANCPKPYCDRTLSREALGGTEATVVRVAGALATRGHGVTVAQKGREVFYTDGAGVRYVPYVFKGVLYTDKPDAVLVINSFKILKEVRSRYGEARLFLWSHCFPGKNRKRLSALALEHDCTLVTVSKTHEACLREFLSSYESKPTVTTPEHFPHVTHVYNPVADDLAPGGDYDPNKLVFFSSPHKGLAQVLQTFEHLRRARPSLKLYIANPGYIALAPDLAMSGVEVLGALSHREVLAHVRTAFCVFYPQSSFKETFGLVFAEANALGTPVLTHAAGAAPEVLGDARQLVNADNPEAVKARLLGWYAEGRPKVGVNPQFRLSRVAQCWEELARGEAYVRRASKRTGLRRGYLTYKGVTL